MRLLPLFRLTSQRQLRVTKPLPHVHARLLSNSRNLAKLSVKNQSLSLSNLLPSRTVCQIINKIEDDQTAILYFSYADQQVSEPESIEFSKSLTVIQTRLQSTRHQACIKTSLYQEFHNRSFAKGASLLNGTQSRFRLSH